MIQAWKAGRRRRPFHLAIPWDEEKGSLMATTLFLDTSVKEKKIKLFPIIPIKYGLCQARKNFEAIGRFSYI